MANDPSIVDHQRRRSGRIATCLPAVIVDGGGKALTSCVVRNLSATGAKLVVPSTAGLPEHIVLHLDGGDTRWPGRIVRRTRTELGVRFK